MKQRLAMAVLTVVGAALGVLLGEAILPDPEQPEPVVVVCTWGHGCQQTDEPRG